MKSDISGGYYLKKAACVRRPKSQSFRLQSISICIKNLSWEENDIKFPENRPWPISK